MATAACWASLPQEVVQRIAARLPPEARLAVSATCGGWRDALRSPRCWRVLDASAAGGCAVAERSLEAMLRAASRRARGTLEELSLAGRTLPQHAVEALLWAHTGALRTVRLQGGAWVQSEHLERMLSLAGERATLHACCDVWLPSAANAATVLRLVAGGRLVLHGLQLHGIPHVGDADAAASAAALLRELSRQAQRDARIELIHLHLDAQPAAAREAVVDALAACDAATEVCVTACGLSAAALLPAVAPLGGLRTLAVSDDPGLLPDAAAHAALADALRRSGATLTHVRLRGVCAAGGGARELVCSVAAAELPALVQLQLCHNGAPAEQQQDEEAEEAGGAGGGEDSYPDDSSDDDVSRGARGAADEVAEAAACAELWPPFLRRSRLLRELSLPWLRQATLPPLLAALERRVPLLTRLELRIRNPTPGWLRGALLHELRHKRSDLCVHLHLPDACLMWRHERNLLYDLERLEEGPHRAPEAPPRAAWRPWSSCEGRAGASYLCLDDFDLDTAAGRAAFSKADSAARQLQRCALRGPPSSRLPWQLGERDYGALPVDVIASVWRLLDARSRVACIGVCRAWRAAFAPPYAWESVTLAADASPALLRLLAAQCAGLSHFRGDACTELSKDDAHGFLWAVASKHLTQVYLPCFSDGDGSCQYSVGELNVLSQILSASSRHCHIEADVCASHGPLLVAQLEAHPGLCARTLVLSGGDDASWDLPSLLRCMQLVRGIHRGATAASPFRRLCLSQLFVHWAPRSSGYVGDAERYAPLDAALRHLSEARLECFEAHSCRLTRRFVPLICALLRNGLTQLELTDNPRLLRNSAQLLADGIRDGAQLSYLMLTDVSFATQVDVATVLRGCAGHPALSLLDIELCSADGGQNRPDEATAVADALAGLVAANARVLTIQLYGTVTAAQLEPMCDALRAGGHRVDSVWCQEAELSHALQAAIAAGRSQPQ
jgi:hypothetical protein